MNLIKSYIHDSLRNIYPSEELRSMSIVIIRDILGIDMSDYYIGKDTKLSTKKKQLLDDTIERLKRFEPIQYIRGTADFYGMSFKVAPGVLIPRPETEELVEIIVKESENKDGLRILDIGSGSGCIAITLSKKLPKAIVESWDISPEALEIARSNNQDLGGSVSFNQVDVLKEWPSGNYDIIVSNPPYIAEKEKVQMEQNVLGWEPGLALFVPDDEPLMFYSRIAGMGRDRVNPGGRIYFEINQAYGQETVSLLEENYYRDVRVIRDLNDNDRIVVALK